MTPRTTAPFRADHVGSLLRPAGLLEARGRHAAGEITAEELRATEDVAIADAVRLQRDVGLRGITDGEFRRGSWHMDFIYGLEGVERSQEHNDVEFHNAGGTITFQPVAPAVTGRIGVARTIFGEDFQALQRIVGGDGTPKLTIPSPSMVHYGAGRARIDAAVYPDLDAFWDDLGTAYAEEIRRLGELGCTYLQLDDTSLAYFNDPSQREFIASIGGDAERQHERYIATINRALEGRPEGMAVTTHLCRGNYKSSWHAEGSYEYVAEALFGGLEVDGFFLEYDDERSGGFEPLRFVPQGRQVVLGLVTTKSAELEREDELKRRIEEASRHLDVDQLCLSPQCGFSSTVDGNDLTIEEQAAKLRLVVEVAQDVWG
jgi:5-methyltetrahydropteroyltriglutamate--homocysteine methyltransferase